jgi:hypothetical protein
LTRLEDGVAIREWGGPGNVCVDVPAPLVLPTGEQVRGPVGGVDYAGYRLDPWMAELPSSAVKTEARRRIVARYPDWKQANMLARGLELQDIFRRVGAWTAAEQAEAAALDAAWAWIKAIRQVSDSIEAMQPIPADFAANVRWTVTPAPAASAGASSIIETLAAMAAEIEALKAALASLVRAAQGGTP